MKCYNHTSWDRTSELPICSTALVLDIMYLIWLHGYCTVLYYYICICAQQHVSQASIRHFWISAVDDGHRLSHLTARDHRIGLPIQFREEAICWTQTGFGAGNIGRSNWQCRWAFLQHAVQRWPEWNTNIGLNFVQVFGAITWDHLMHLCDNLGCRNSREQPQGVIS